ncbi:hypothetical protein ACPFUG_003342 [Vibrio cholerae]
MDKSPSQLGNPLESRLIDNQCNREKEQKKQNCEPFPEDVNRTPACYNQFLNANTKTTNSVAKKKPQVIPEVLYGLSGIFIRIIK